jgi:uncharacterized protein
MFIEIIFYLLTLFMGTALGMMGSGGSILLVPAMVYFLGINPVIAADYSMFVVGVSTLFAVIRSWSEIKKHQAVIVGFGLPSVIGIAVMRRYLLPMIPEIVYQSDGFVVTQKSMIMVIFAICMTLVARNMIIPLKPKVSNQSSMSVNWLLPVIGLCIGLLSGLLGVGGGFIIVPVLALTYRYPMQQAVTISLFLIAANAIFGFASTMPFYRLEIVRLILMTISCICGMYIGLRLSPNIDSNKLKVGFGWFIALVGIIVLGKELL